MPKTIFFIYKIVIVSPAFISGVVWRINVDYIDLSFMSVV